jgi:hypothetical protein
MALFVLTAKGPCALEVRIVRAKDLAEVERDFLPAIQCEHLFHTYKVKELLVDGETEEVFQIAHVE